MRRSAYHVNILVSDLHDLSLSVRLARHAFVRAWWATLALHLGLWWATVALSWLLRRRLGAIVVFVLFESHLPPVWFIICVLCRVLVRVAPSLLS